MKCKILLAGLLLAVVLASGCAQGEQYPFEQWFLTSEELCAQIESDCENIKIESYSEGMGDVLYEKEFLDAGGNVKAKRIDQDIRGCYNTTCAKKYFQSAMETAETNRTAARALEGLGDEAAIAIVGDDLTIYIWVRQDHIYQKFTFFSGVDGTYSDPAIVENAKRVVQKALNKAAEAEFPTR